MNLLKIGILSLITILSNLSFAQVKEITLKDIFEDGTFEQKNSSGLRTMKDGEHYTVLENQSDIVRYNIKTGKIVDTILFIQKVKPAMISKIQDYEFNGDESKIMLISDIEYIYRHSYKANYQVYYRKERFIKTVSDIKIQLATWSPKGTEIAYVSDNNLYIKYLLQDKVSKVTINGEKNKIINGTPDWVYEEEFGFSKAFEWSPDGSYLAYYKFDESKVKQYNFSIYDDLYPSMYQYKYPKTGDSNSVVSIHVYNLENRGTRTVNTGMEVDQYLPRIKWTRDPKLLSIQRLNRLQNKLEILVADVVTEVSKVVYTEENEQYVDITDDLFFLDDKKSFLITSEKMGYNHIFMNDLSGNEIRQVTSGKWDVIQILGVDEKKGLIYYLSSEDSPLTRHVYSIDFKGKEKIKLTTRDGVNSAEFCEGFNYFVNNNTSAKSPLYSSINDNTGKEIRQLETNEELIGKIAEYGFSPKEFLTIKSEGEELNAWIIKPPTFNEGKKYPVLMYVYGGPGSQTVMNDWSRDMAWYQMLAHKGYIIVSVDNRGTGARGEKFKKLTYLELGKYETIDQTNAAKYLASLPYVDKSRIGIWGWSYGGYMSSLCLFRSPDVFKAAIAVAPVSNWRYYDNIYTERFMRTPKENADGYDNNSPINYVGGLKGKYLLVHGTADDNVHFQNSMELVKELVAANKQFDVFFYPNSNHGMNQKKHRYHLYTKMTDFILTNL